MIKHQKWLHDFKIKKPLNFNYLFKYDHRDYQLQLLFLLNC